MQDAVTQGRESSSPPSTDLVAREARLTNRIELLDIGLRVHGELNWAEFEDAASSLQRVGRAWQFWIGDILCYGERRFGERYAQVLDAADRWGMKIETLRTAQWVSEKIPLVARSTSLSWYHHKLVAGLETEERRALLAKAEEAGSSTRELQDAVQTFKQQLKSGGTATSDSATTASSFPTLDPEAGAEDEMDSRDVIVAALEEAQVENERLTAKVERLEAAIEADDQAAKIAELTQLNMQLDANHQNTIDGLAKAQNDATFYRELASRLSKMLDSPHREVEARVKELVENLAKWKNFGARLSGILGVEGKDIISAVEALKNRPEPAAAPQSDDDDDWEEGSFS